MGAITLVILKYVTSLTTVALAVAGAWFYDFTVTDKTTGRKSLTVWGRRAIVVAAVSLCLAAVTTVLSDIESATKRAEAEERSKIDRAAAEEERKAAAKSRDDVSRVKELSGDLVQIFRAEFGTLSDKGKMGVAKALLEKLETIEDVKRAYPEFYQKLIEANSPGGREKVLEQFLGLNVERRISKRSECAALPLESLARPGDPIVVVDKSAHIGIARNTLVGIRVTPDGVVISFVAGGEDLSGIVIRFTDGTIGDRLVCGRFSCSFGPREKDLPAALYRLLEGKTIAAIEMDSKVYQVSPETGATLKRLFSCLTP